MRAGADTAVARVGKVFGAARPHHAYLFANKRATRMKVLVYDGFGIWLAGAMRRAIAAAGETLREALLKQTALHADETQVQMLKPGNGKTQGPTCGVTAGLHLIR